MKTIIVSGAIANKVGNAGGPWERLSWMLGLQRLGFDVHFVEQIAPEACVDCSGATTGFEQSANVAWFRKTTEWFGIADQASLVCGKGEETCGLSFEDLQRLAASADLLVNLSGHLTVSSLLAKAKCKAYIDVDPGFTQFWHEDSSTPYRVENHDIYCTIGERIGDPECDIPTGGMNWHHVRQPVILEQWPMKASTRLARFTTVASWRSGFGPVQYGKKTYGLKVHEFRKFLGLPKFVKAACEIALDIHPGDERDQQQLRQNGWQLADPGSVAGDAAAFRTYVQKSDAEFSVAQGIYVDTNSGWFSDRSVRYLASGKPVLVQDTGFSRNLPVGVGLLSFRTLDEAVAGAEEIARNYNKHARAAREIAVEYFDSDKVLRKMLEEIGSAS